MKSVDIDNRLATFGWTATENGNHYTNGNLPNVLAHLERYGYVRVWKQMDAQRFVGVFTLDGDGRAVLTIEKVIFSPSPDSRGTYNKGYKRALKYAVVARDAAGREENERGTYLATVLKKYSQD